MENYARLTGKVGKYKTYGENNGSAYYFSKIVVTEQYDINDEIREYTYYIDIKANKELAKQMNGYNPETLLTIEGRLKSIKDKQTNQYKTAVEITNIKEEHIEKAVGEILKNDKEDKYSSIDFSNADLPF